MQLKKISSPARKCNLPTLIANKAVNNVGKYKLSQEYNELLKVGLYFSIQPYKLRNSNVLSALEIIRG